MYKQCEVGTTALKGTIINIHGETERVVKQSNINIRWRRLAQHVAGGEDQVQPISHKKLCGFIMARDEFCYCVTQPLS